MIRVRQITGTVLLVLWSGCYGPPPPEPATQSAAVIELRLAGDLRRAPVRFDHAQHLKVVVDSGEKDACKSCHPIDEQGTVVPLFHREADIADHTAATEHYHQKCMACHREHDRDGKKTGPLLCGECHVGQEEAPSAWQQMTFDYSLHHRHERNYVDDCGACHHVYDEATKTLAHKKGAESACRDCHGKEDDGKNFSLANASHRACISCHRARGEKKQETGPIECAGCHDAGKQQAIEKLKQVPRLERQQPTLTWIHAPEASSKVVLFNHELHEPLTKNCSTCHHQTLKACSECHKVEAVAEGGGVSLEQAYHRASSEHSCVGCHSQESAKKACRGCHQVLTPPPGEAACLVCHAGPQPGAEKLALPEPVASQTMLADLPADSHDFPAQVEIGTLAKKYQAAKFPHRKIVAALHQNVVDSRLATAMHSKTETLCAGCHHHSPVGERPAACGACHDAKGTADKDQPDLFTAYHRQCVGCHQQMGLKQQGCTDCHAEAAQEVEK